MKPNPVFLQHPQPPRPALDHGRAAGPCRARSALHLARRPKATHCRPGTTAPPRASITNFVARVTTQGGPDFVPPDQRIATFDNDGTLWCEQPDVRPVRFRLRPRQGAGAAAPGLEGQAAVPGGAGRRHEGARRVRPTGPRRADGGDPRRHDDGRIHQDRLRLACHRARSPVQAALHRADLSADAGAARLPARQRLQDLHRLRRRHRVHAPVDRAGLRHSARAGRRLVDQDQVRDARRPARSCSGCREINFIDDKAGKPVGINEHIGRRPIAAFGNSDGDLEMLQWTTHAAAACASA